MTPAWSFCILCLAAAGLEMDDVGFRLVQTGSSSKLMVNGQETGCTISTQGVEMTCEDIKNFGGSLNLPANAFRPVIDCQQMDATQFDAVSIRSSPMCSKLTYTKHFKAGAVSNTSETSEALDLKPGEVANFTCLLFPLPNTEKGLARWMVPVSVELDVTARNSKTNQSGTVKWEIGTIKWRTEDKQKVDSKTCSESVVKAAFKWKMRLQKSSQNVHQLLWTNVGPKSDPMDPIESLPGNVTGCLKDVTLKEMGPNIFVAMATKNRKGLADHKNFRRVVTLKVGKPLLDSAPDKHEEQVELLVDATQLPSNTEEVFVAVDYFIEGGGSKKTFVWLPVTDPGLPDSEPDQPDTGTVSPTDTTMTPKDPTDGTSYQPAKSKPTDPDTPKKKKASGGIGAAFWWIPGCLFLGMGIGIFFYRRNRLIQAYGRDVR